MAIIKAFKAIRPVKDMAGKVAALPYDVMSREEAEAMVQDNSLSFLRVDRAEIEFGHNVAFNNSMVYKKAAENLRSLIDQGILAQDRAECLYIYRLEARGKSQAGLVACLSVDEYLEGVIKKHENTRPDKELDRTNHILECNANTGPILLFYREQKEIQIIMDGWMKENCPVYDFTSEDGVVHRIWVIDKQETIDKLAGLFDRVDSLYIADGHHRCAAAARACLEKRKSAYRGDEEFNFFLGVVFPHNRLNILDYNRVVNDLNGLSQEEFIQKVSKRFELSPWEPNKGTGTASEMSPAEEVKAYRPQQRHNIGMYVGNKWYRLKAIPGTWDADDPIECLDVSILQKQLLEPVLGIKDPRTDGRIEFVGCIRGLGQLEKMVNGGKSAAFSLYPTSIQELIDVADAGRVMPPKSTWFEPKLRSGLFIHDLG